MGFCLFVLRLNVPVNNHVSFQSCRDGANASRVLLVLSGSKVSAQGQGSVKSWQLHPAGDVLWVFVEPGNVVP